MRLSRLAAVLLALLVALSMVQLGPPVASALGCDNVSDWRGEGPYSFSLQGFTSVEKTPFVQQGGLLINVFTVKPGGEASMRFAFKYVSVPIIQNVTLRPAAGIPTEFTINPVPSWLSVFFGPGVVVVPEMGSVNVTAILRISKDAPLGAYVPLMFYGEPQNDEYDRTHCQYAPLNFALRVAPENEKNAIETVTQSTTITATLTSITTVTTTETVADPSIYAWAVGATAIAATLALTLLRKRS